MVCCREKIQIEISQRKTLIWENLGEVPYTGSFYYLLPVKSGHITLLASMCDDMNGVLLTGAVHLSLSVQSFYWTSIA